MIEIRDHLRCALPENVRIEEGAGGLPLLRVLNSHGACSAYLYGAHIVSFTPRGEKRLAVAESLQPFPRGLANSRWNPYLFPLVR